MDLNEAGPFDAAGEFDRADAAIDGKGAQNGQIEAIMRWVVWHEKPPIFAPTACLLACNQEKHLIKSVYDGPNER
jgi:hypothetical protein